MRGSATYWALFIVVVIIVVAMLAGLWPRGQSFEEATGLIDSDLWHELKGRAGQGVDVVEGFVLSEIEKREIDVWLREQGLNQYGDSVETVYAGGTPLFNEMTGKTIDKYDYIIKNHPDRPWRK